MKKTAYILLTLLTLSIFSSCFDDQDDVLGNTNSLDIRNFIYNGMNIYYLYKADTPELADNAFASTEERNTYLNSFSSPEDFFYNGLLSNADHFSFLVDDYIELEQNFSGISRNHGMRFGLVRYPNDPSLVFGYVRYVVPNSPAADTGLQRGDIFTTIGGTQMTEDNFNDLLGASSYTIGLADFDGTTITPNNQSVALEKVELTENPIHISTTLDVNGNAVGYLMYNAFIGNFDSQLNTVFGQFSGTGITDLILDLRYNGGGSVRTAIDLSSMITGQFTGDIVTTEQWNAEIQAALEANDPGRLENRFGNQIRTGEAINSLNLTRVYILTSPRTASASELVINGLNPYIDVIQVGTNTTGKFQASVTLYDSEDFGRNGANPGHTYAIQPLVLKEINSVGHTDFFNGLEPDVDYEEDYANLGVLGDPTEPLLAAALQSISGFAPNTQTERFNRYEEIGESEMNAPMYQKMYKDFK